MCGLCGKLCLLFSPVNEVSLTEYFGLITPTEED